MQGRSKHATLNADKSMQASVHACQKCTTAYELVCTSVREGHAQEHMGKCVQCKSKRMHKEVQGQEGKQACEHTHTQEYKD